MVGRDVAGDRPLVPGPGDRFGFIGVTASQSKINAVFPRWVEVLGLDGVELHPVDLPVGTPAEEYRRVVQAIRDDPRHHGALVTTHKVRVFEAARDLFAELDYYAELCSELSCISKREGRLRGYAKDPITAGRAMEEFLPPNYFGETSADVLCLGAGGSGLAISIYLMTRPSVGDRPRRIILVNRSGPRLEQCREIHAHLPSVTTAVEYVKNESPERNQLLMESLPPGSLVINATGMGKDRPGSPLADGAAFPQGGIAWELNYRGDLRFLEEARSQAEEHKLTIVDGWSYFVHGWSEVIAEAFGLELTPEVLERLSAEAEAVRL